MGQKSSIEWTEATWNPVTGCTKISPGCAHCYAERMANRLKAMGVRRYRDGFNVRLQPDVLSLPTKWVKPRLIFVNSMSDLFHPQIPLDYITKVFMVMCKARQHTFQILTKRAERLAELAPFLPWPSNVWMGVSVESPTFCWRIPHLRSVPAAVRFLSVEPLLAPIPDLPLNGINWVIVGGESGANCRPIATQWVSEIKAQCTSASVPFFFKQWGGKNKKSNGRTLEGKLWNDMPRWADRSGLTQISL